METEHLFRHRTIRQMLWAGCIDAFLSDYTFCVFLGIGWRAEVHPKTHPVSELEFDVIIGADGRRNTLPGKSACTDREKCISNAVFPWLNREHTNTTICLLFHVDLEASQNDYDLTCVQLWLGCLTSLRYSRMNEHLCTSVCVCVCACLSLAAYVQRVFLRALPAEQNRNCWIGFLFPLYECWGLTHSHTGKGNPCGAEYHGPSLYHWLLL